MAIIRENDKVRIQDFDDLYVIKFLTTFFVSCQNMLVTVWWVPAGAKLKM